MDFALPADVESLRARIAAFVRERIVPLEADRANYDAHENIAPEVLARMQAEVKAAGLWAPQVPRAHGGLGLTVVGRAACYEEMNASIFGPVCFNCAAPDDGNMTVLAKVATTAQQARWLAPIVDGRVRSAFVMTEPHPGGGSDPVDDADDRATARRHAGSSTAANGSSPARRSRSTSFCREDLRRCAQGPDRVHVRPRPARLADRAPHPDHGAGRTRRALRTRVRRPRNSRRRRLMDVGDGLKLTQIRLGTARLTHCMRWLGLARRSLAIALDYVTVRENHGRKLAELDSVQGLLGEAAMQIEIGRLLTMRAAVKLDAGDFARKEISMAKIVVADALHHAVDTGIQLCGARGYSKDTVLEWIYRYARQARLVDGASEVHKGVLARYLQDERDAFWKW